ncbi:MAG: hypothetical protein KDI12_22990 [Anaerolineae bacterium]|nr:hypothetical protein [Anaerolineae bacterium]
MRIDSPFADYPDAWIELPDRWLGRHATRYAEAIEAGKREKLIGRVLDFSVSLVLLDNWVLPGLTGPPDKWDFQQLPLEIIEWVAQTVLLAFNAVRIIPKNSLPLSPSGLATGEAQPGT